MASINGLWCALLSYIEHYHNNYTKLEAPEIYEWRLPDLRKIKGHRQHLDSHLKTVLMKFLTISIWYSITMHTKLSLYRSVPCWAETTDSQSFSSCFSILRHPLPRESKISEGLWVFQNLFFKNSSDKLCANINVKALESIHTIGDSGLRPWLSSFYCWDILICIRALRTYVRAADDGIAKRIGLPNRGAHLRLFATRMTWIPDNTHIPHKLTMTNFIAFEWKMNMKFQTISQKFYWKSNIYPYTTCQIKLL